MLFSDILDYSISMTKGRKKDANIQVSIQIIGG
jgi:hypothetical protein